MIYRVRILLLLLCLCGCSAGGSKRVLRLGIDPSWAPLDFGVQCSYVNGYTEDLLLEMARYSGMEFELVRANWDTLWEGLKEGRYDALITGLAPYEYHLARYDFSPNFLDLGPVLIVPKDAKKNSLNRLEGELVGILYNDPAELLLAEHPTIIVRKYKSIPELLNAVAIQEIEGALLPQIPAVNYVGDLYLNVLEIASEPLTDQGIHIVGPKGSLHRVTRTLETLRKRKTVHALQQKWDLTAD